METEHSDGKACDICKVNYSSESELEEHLWSLMHHIKLEKIKKGAPHSCNLCMESCANIIEYGKHLNEDRHKMALSRRGKEASEMLDSFSGTGSLLGKDGSERLSDVHPPDIGSRDQVERQGDRSGRHSRSFSQPEYFQQEVMLDPQHSGPSSYNRGSESRDWMVYKNNSQGQQKPQDWRARPQQGWGGQGGQDFNFKVPRGRPGHFRTHSDIPHNFNAPGQHSQTNKMPPPMQQANFFHDDFGGMNWQDNSFYGFQQGNMEPMQQYGGFGRGGRPRRGSFDGNFQHRQSFMPSPGEQNWDGSDRHERPERGRGRFRDGPPQKRGSSYDNISPESTSSSDSGVKRRRENDDILLPGKSRHKGEPTRSTSFPSKSSLMDDHGNQRSRSRSTSRDRLRDSGYGKSETDSESRQSGRKVTWSDQHVSSSTETARSTQSQKDKLNQQRRGMVSPVPNVVLPDSSSESEDRKRGPGKGKGRRKSLSPRGAAGKMKAAQRTSKIVAGDQTESVLEKAEKLCKKLRSDREKAKMRRKDEEKSKKLEKEHELNKKISSLAEMNKTHIRGILDSDVTTVSSKGSVSSIDGNSYRVPSLSESVSSNEPSASRRAGHDSSIPARGPERPLTPSRLTPTRDVGKNNIAERIAQTKADIDHIRAKIEASVRNEMPQSGSSTDTLQPPKYPQTKDKTSLMKMVNSPRTTKERLSLAQMLREHARSQTKLSLPRFNLRYSDLCSGSDRHDEYTNINVESLAPDVQLQIANLLEADVKPDVSQLERLLDQACEGNAELDANFLSDLGLNSPNKANNASSPIVIDSLNTERREGRLSKERSKSPVRSQSPSRLLPLTKDFTYGSKLDVGKESRGRSASPLTKYDDELPDIPPTRPDIPTSRLTASPVPSYRSSTPVSMPAKDSTDRGLPNQSNRMPGYRSPKPIAERERSSPRPLDSQDHTPEYEALTSPSDRNMPPPRRVLTIEELRSEQSHGLQATSSSFASTSHTSSTSFATPSSIVMTSSLPESSSLPISAIPRSSDNRPSSAVLVSGSHTISTKDSIFGSNSLSTQRLTEPIVSVKQEKMDEGYDKALGLGNKTPSAAIRSRTLSVDNIPSSGQDVTKTGLESQKHQSVTDLSGRISPVRRSIHTQNLYNGGDEMPVRDAVRNTATPTHGETNSAVDKVSKILDAVPTPDYESRGDKSSTPITAATPSEKVKPLDSSVHSQASILDEVYRISLREESVRTDINTVDLKINKLKTLIEEASDQLRKCAQERQQLIDQEKSCRTKRLQLLEESRSSSACSHPGVTPGTAGAGDPGIGGIPTDLPTSFGDNPVFMKFLMSQRTSDLSSLGGYSNVESGSQPDLDRNVENSTGQRRASLTSNISEPVTSAEASSVQPLQNRGLFAQSLDVLTGSTETITSAHSQGFSATNIDSPSNTPKTSAEFHEKSASANKSVSDSKETINSTNSFSFLNSPLDKVGFVTLDALMKGDSDIGKLLHKSLESIERGTVPEGASPLAKQASAGSQKSDQSSSKVRERRDSSFSISSDPGSDSEKRKLSMKYMGTLPEGINYETFIRQMSQENKNKSLTFTLFSSPEANSKLMRTPDAGLRTPTNLSAADKGVPAMDIGYKSDTNSNRTLTDVNEGESQSARSTFSLGEQIKQMCDNQNKAARDQQLEMQTPRSGTETMEDVTPRAVDRSSLLMENGLKPDGTTDTRFSSEIRDSPVRDCSVMLEDCSRTPPGDLLKRDESRLLQTSSPFRKKLKSKKERDQMSRRKQKESFILQSDTNSEGETVVNVSPPKMQLSTAFNTRSEEELVCTGSEDVTPRPSAALNKSSASVTAPSTAVCPVIDLTSMDTRDRTSVVKRSLLDEVQLETETPSDSCEDRSLQMSSANPEIRYGSISYEGPGISVACMQEFKGDLYICYNGSEIRRFDIKTGRVLKELDCSPFLVSCLHVTSVEDRGDILYTGGPCKKLLMFEPQKFNLIENINYSTRLTCLHENWGWLFVGFADGSVTVTSTKTDKVVNTISCTSSPVHCMVSTSAGMTRMLCLATGDKVIYIVDANSGLLITMLEGHTQPSLYLQIVGEKLVSGGMDQTLMVHSVNSGELLRMATINQATTHMFYHENCLYVVTGDRYIKSYNMDLRSGQVYTCENIATCCIVADDKLIVGLRNGLTRATNIGQNTCQFGKCRLEFTKAEMLKLHVMSEHVSTSLTHCEYRGCNHVFQPSSRRQTHILSHLK